LSHSHNQLNDQNHSYSQSNKQQHMLTLFTLTENSQPLVLKFTDVRNFAIFVQVAQLSQTDRASPRWHSMQRGKKSASHH